MSIRIGDQAPNFQGADNGGPHRFPSVDWGLMGSAVFPSEGLHARLHDRARLHGEAQARVRQARRQDHRAQRRPGRQARAVGAGHQGDAGTRAELPDDRRHGSEHLEAVRHAAGRSRGLVRRPHGGGQPDRAQRLRDRTRQEGQADDRLSDDAPAGTSTRCCA